MCIRDRSSKISYLEMAAAVCAVVNGGKLMQPYVVSEILAPDGSTIEQLSPEMCIRDRLCSAVCGGSRLLLCGTRAGHIRAEHCTGGGSTGTSGVVQALSLIHI